MKKLSETYKELGIAFTFPIEIEDYNGNQTYFEASDGYWDRYEWDDKGRATYREDSGGNWERYERDDNDRVTYLEDSDDFWWRYERDDKGRPTYHEDSNGFWSKWDRDDNGDVDYYEDSTGVKKGTPKSAKAYITIDRDFADILKAAPTPPTPEFKRALRAYRDFIIGHI